VERSETSDDVGYVIGADTGHGGRFQSADSTDGVSITVALW
jgi:hypothetical protein